MNSPFHLLVNALLLLASLAPSALTGCTCDDSDALAELVEFDGHIDRDFAARMYEWLPAEIGASFTLGDGVRANKESSAVLRLSEGSYVRLIPETQIRFQRNMPDARTHGIDVETGEAEFIVGENELRLHTGVGLAVFEPGSRFRLHKVEGGVELHVEIGRASFQVGKGEEDVVNAGESVKIAIGAAVLTRLGAEEPSSQGAEPESDTQTTT